MPDGRDRVVVAEILAHLAGTASGGLRGAAGERAHRTHLEVGLLSLRGSVVTGRPAPTARSTGRCTEGHLKHALGHQFTAGDDRL